MGQRYPFANYNIEGKTVTLIMVAEAGIATPEAAQQSMTAMKARLKKDDIVLVAQGVSLAPTYIGNKSYVDKLKNVPLGSIPWGQVEM